MKRFHILFLLTCMLIFGGAVVHASSHHGSEGIERMQEQLVVAPSIRHFEADVIEVSRNSLVSRTARIPVTWDVASRPAGSNLSFDQVMPDGTLRNVELPRPDPYVASSGVGIAAPYDPGNAVNQIVLRLSLINLSNSNVLAQSTVTIPIGNRTTPPTIRTFTTDLVNVSRGALGNRSARIPVAWDVIARPENSNLSFDQVMPDGTLRNVELPRPNPYVSSSGTGLAAPFDPGSSIDEIVIRLSLIDLPTSTVLTQVSITVAIGNQSTPPQIRSFTTTSVNVQRTALINRTARIPVAWDVILRPENSNLSFDQVMPNGTLRNVELPRPNPFVSSSGVGVAAPFDPGPANEIVLRLSLVDLATGNVLTQANITLPIAESGGPPPISNNIEFDVQPRDATTGDTVTITWDAGDVDGVGILFHHTGMPVISNSLPSNSGSGMFNFPPSGSTQVEMDLNRDEYTFWLVYPDASTGSGSTTTQPISVDVTFDCLDEWFADNGQIYCPSNTVQSTPAAYQAFERGFMVWHQNKIWIIPNGGTLRYAADNWNGEEITFDEAPPAGLLLPQRGFGAAWTQSQAIRDALGWATQEEQSYTMQIQYAENPVYSLSTGGGGRFYTFSLPDNRVMSLYEHGSGSISDPVGP